MRGHERWLVLACLMVVGSCASGAKRPMTPDDFLRLETIGKVALSPDGMWVAYVVERPIASASRFGRMYLYGSDRGDVWVVPPGHSEPQNITRGNVDDAGFWEPVWSPDGKWLAMLSTRGGNVRLWMWSRSSGELRMISERAVNFWPFASSTPGSETFLWVSDHEILFWVAAEGEKAKRLTANTRGPERAASEWARAWSGREATASVLESGVESVPEARGGASLLLADVATGGTRRLSDSLWNEEFSFATLRLSPDHRSVAFLKQVGVWKADPHRRVTELIDPIYALEVVELRGRRETSAFVGLTKPLAGSLLWAPDSRELAVLASDDVDAAHEEVFRCKLETLTCRAAATDAVTVDLQGRNVVSRTPYIWLDRDRVLIYGQGASSPAPRRAKWWVAGKERTLQEFFRATDSSEIPTQLVTDPQKNELLGLLNGDVWRIGNDGGLAENLTPNLHDKIVSLDFPQFGYEVAGTKIALVTGRAEEVNLNLLNRSTGNVETVRKPSAGAKLEAFDANARTLVFSTQDDAGVYLWKRDAGQEKSRVFFKTNLYLAEIERGTLRSISYRGLDGQDLKGWAILPPGYVEARRYPVVVWAYPSLMYSDQNPPEYLYEAGNSQFFLNLQLLAARGYVVLMPSMPQKPYSEVEDTYMELTKGVLPAVDKLIEMGVADRQRIGLMGHSYGGYSVYGLVTQTKRFKAAVAIAGLSDFLSLYGTFSSSVRYDRRAQEDPFRMWILESGKMGVPPWTDLQRYIRNSPVSYAERVETPLLIIQGDLDYVPIGQGEEFFTALYRQNKRARFVRYWGEDHLFTSPANIRDVWQRIYDWFDGYMKGSE